MQQELVTLFLCATIVVLIFGWAVWYRRFQAHDPQTLIARIASQTRAIHTITSEYDEAKQRERDDEVWGALGGLGGIRIMARNAGILADLAFTIGNECPEEFKESIQIISERAIYLRFSLVLCLLECGLLRIFENLSIPRQFMRMAAEQYSQAWGELRTIIEVLQPQLLDAYDAVI